ncbi:similar to Saccharomyces cerevisiae YIL055C Putative protein of unknown function [Maudiozyma barnettii]|uniref:Uncharacterized protein n=1 Tax=Maudiozyma barnettii TaxID=61262 RepID=A0A8H2ZEG0_9SACH|nr:hypothetical protein [Kazachstania barnettii]CAB4252251.1 similar to Saccharomyces cerevisiae YIL055C Putative protein of unknown function [Kazachstania barnettii]CAD1778921.1 similar to Saccharomyces cerevisiae YIL055C Putative protein of unknown function [Kazachstania barnettii]
MSLHSPPKSPKSFQKHDSNLSNFYEQSLNAIRIRIDNLPPGKTWKQIKYLIGGIINHNNIIQVKVLPPITSLIPPFVTLQSCIILLKQDLSQEDLNNLLMTINSYQWDFHDLFSYIIPNQHFPTSGPVPSGYPMPYHPAMSMGSPIMGSPPHQQYPQLPFPSSSSSSQNMKTPLQLLPLSPPLRPDQQQQQQQQSQSQHPLLPAFPLVPGVQPPIMNKNKGNNANISNGNNRNNGIFIPGVSPSDDNGNPMYPMAYPTSFPPRRQLYHQPALGNKYIPSHGHVLQSQYKDHEQELYNSMNMFHMSPRSSISSDHDNIAYLTGKKGLNPFKQPKNLKSIFNETNFRKQMTERKMYQLKLKNFPPYLVSDTLRPLKDKDEHIDLETNYLEKYGKLRWTVLKDFVKLKCPTLLLLQDSEDSDFSLDNTREFYVGVYEDMDKQINVKIDGDLYQVDAVYFNAIIGFKDKELSTLCYESLKDEEYALNYKLDVTIIEPLESEEKDSIETPSSRETNEDIPEGNTNIEEK